MADEHRDRRASGSRAAVTLCFWLYAAVLFVAVRTFAHHALAGWLAKLLTMGGMALGLLPWVHWLRPRVAWTLGIAGRAVMTGCYLVLLLPVAAILRLMRRERSNGSSQWIDRAPRPHTLDASRLEY